MTTKFLRITTATIPMGIVAVVLSTGSQTAIGADYATRVIEFRPAPGQFMNLEITTDPSGVPGPVAGAGSEPATDGIVSLGAFGGYIVLGFDRPSVNDPQHPYGVDFTIIGNAISTGTASESCEPGAVQVMKDLNGNGIPDDGQWLELAGSDYWLSTTRHGLSLTYTDPAYNNAHAVYWEASDGTTGAVLPTPAHTQSYFPDPFLFPDIETDGYTFSGTCIRGSLDKRNPSGIKFHRAPAFGYADAHGTPGGFDGTRPHNPYYADENGQVTDGFDISWAVDAEGNHVELDQIDFIRIYTAGADNAGWLGEWSTEIDGVVLSEPDPDYQPRDYYLHYIATPQAEIALGSTLQLEGQLFKNGRPVQDGTPSFRIADESIGTISADGLFTPIKTGRTTISFSRIDGVPASETEISVVSLTGVVFDINGKASALAQADCIVGEKLFLKAESTTNHAEIFPDEKGNRYTADTYNWYNSNPTVGTIDRFGTFTALAEGTTVITAESRTNPSLYAETKVTVKRIPAVTLNRTSMEITDAAPAGNWRESTLFKTTNRSSVTITSATARNGKFPFELKGNRIVYDCTHSTENFDDILDLEILHYGIPHSFSLPVTFTRNGSSLPLTPADTNAHPGNYTLYTPSGLLLKQSPSPIDTTTLTPGLYILRTPTAVTKLSIP